MSTWAVTWTLFRFTWKAWFNRLTRSTGSAKQAAAIVIGLVMALLGATAASAWGALQAVKGLDILAEAPEVVLGVILCLGALGAIMATLYSPGGDTMMRHLSPLPIAHKALKRALAIQELLIGVVLGTVLAAPIVIQPVISRGFIRGLPIIAVLFLLLTLSGVLSLAAVRLISWALSLLRTPVPLAGAIASLGFLSLLGWAFFLALPSNQNAPSGPLVPLGPLLARGTTGLACLSTTVLLGISSWVLWRLLLMLPEIAQHPHNGRRLSRSSHVVGPAALERRQWLRFPPNLISLCFLGGLALIFLLTARSSGLAAGSSLFVLPLISAIGVGAYGPTRRHHWIFRANGKPYAWIWPKAFAVLAVWAALTGAFGFGLLAVGRLTWQEFLWMLPTLITELFLSLIVGVMLPVDSEQSINGSVSEAVALIVIILSSVALQSWLASTTTLIAGVLVSLVPMGVAIFGYYLIARAVA